MGEQSTTVTLALDGLPADALLEMDLPDCHSSLTPEELLDRLFPPDEAGQQSVEASLNLARNPDLPEIYGELLAVVEQSRHGLCQLEVATDTIPCGSPVEPGRPHTADGSGRTQPPTSPTHLRVTPRYDALGYAAANGFDAGEPDILAWFATCIALYFMDKHEQALTMDGPAITDGAAPVAIGRIIEMGLVETAPEGGQTHVTPEGRKFIGRLLSETEALIDRYDLFKDVCWDEDAEQALFGSGHGADLRVEVYLEEGLDPIRTVFLLRLYDGSLDGCAATWREEIANPDFFNSLLEPVVNRSITPPDLLERIIDAGMAHLESAYLADRNRRTASRLAGRVVYPSSEGIQRNES